MTQLPPIDILAPSYGRQDRMATPLRLALERRNRNVQDRKNQVGTAERLFAREKAVELELAILAVDQPRRHEGDEEHRLADGVLDFRFPQRARRDRLLVLPEPEVLFGASKLCAQLPLNPIPKRRQDATEGFVIFAGVAEE